MVIKEKIKLNNTTKYSVPKKFVILTSPRSGSTFFRLFLNNHPQVRCHGEVFLYKYGAIDGFPHFCYRHFHTKLIFKLFSNKISLKLHISKFLFPLVNNFLNIFYDKGFHPPLVDVITFNKYDTMKNKKNIKVIGFKLMYGQFKSFPILKNYFSDPSFYVIHLIRSNSLEKYLSRIRMKRSNIAHTNREIFYDKVKISINNMLKMISEDEKEINNMRKMLALKEKYIEIFYEDVVSDIRNTLLKIENFLELDHFNVKMPTIKKIAQRKVSDEIDNYNEVIAALNNKK